MAIGEPYFQWDVYTIKFENLAQCHNNVRKIELKSFSGVLKVYKYELKAIHFWLGFGALK